jgi:single-strand DNA-binding protein
MNVVCLTGGLTRDPELRTTGSGTDVCTMRLGFRQGATDSGYVDVACFGATARAVAEHKRSGHQVAITGELRWREWLPDGSDVKRQAYEVVASRVDFLGHTGSADAPASVREAAQAGGAEWTDAQAAAVNADDDIPF